MRLRDYMLSGSLVLATVGTLGALRSPSLADTSLPAIGSGGGTAFTRRCPAGHVLSGMRWRQGLVVDAIGIKCRPVGSDGELGAEITVGTMVGGSGGTFGSASCRHFSADQPFPIIVEELAGGAGVGLAVLTFYCRPWYKEPRIFGGGSATSQVDVRRGGAVTTLRTCPNSDSPAVGIHGRHGSIVDAVGLICGKP